MPNNHRHKHMLLMTKLHTHRHRLSQLLHPLQHTGKHKTHHMASKQQAITMVHNKQQVGLVAHWYEYRNHYKSFVDTVCFLAWSTQLPSLVDLFFPFTFLSFTWIMKDKGQDQTNSIEINRERKMERICRHASDYIDLT